MTVARIRRWREWFYQTFVRHGLFALRPLPRTDAERREAAERRVPPDDLTRLDLDPDSDRSP